MLLPIEEIFRGCFLGYNCFKAWS